MFKLPKGGVNISLIIIYGDIGSGKTLLATAIAVNEKDRDIYSNYKIKCDRWNNLEPQMLYGINKPTLAILDEAYSYLESRMSGKDINRYLSYILFQSRKRHIDFILTAQLLSTIDLRYKGLADTYIYAERTKNSFNYVAMFPGRRSRRIFTMPFDIAGKYFTLYDTFEKVDPIDDELMYKVTPDKSTFIPELDTIIADMLKMRNDWTKGMVDAYCLEKLLPHSYVDLLYNRMRLKAPVKGMN